MEAAKTFAAIDDSLPLLHGESIQSMSFSRARSVFLAITIAGLAMPVFAQSTQGLPAVPQVAGVPAAAQQAAQHIDPERIRSSVKYLADDKLEGRGPGTAGDRLAAKYIAEQFAAYGLTPAGDDGSWYQK